MAQNVPQEREGKRQGGPFGSLTLASILVWAGIVLLLENLNLLRGINWGTWSIIMAGVGVIFLIQALVRLLISQQGQSSLPSLVIGIIFLVIGIGRAFSWRVILPAAMIAAGLAILFRRLFRQWIPCF